MDKYIAFCGLDCRKCAAYIATKNDDDKLRAEVAKEWSKLNKVEILPSMINCEGCRIDGKKTPFCSSMCGIRICACVKKMETCGSCNELFSCEKIKMITGNNNEALENLKNKS